MDNSAKFCQELFTVWTVLFTVDLLTGLELDGLQPKQNVDVELLYLQCLFCVAGSNVLVSL